jgi:hypothetical protein
MNLVYGNGEGKEASLVRGVRVRHLYLYPETKNSYLGNNGK